MDNASHNAIVNFIWGIANDVLRHHMFAAQYRDVILPMTVIRRPNLRDTKQVPLLE